MPAESPSRLSVLVAVASGAVVALLVGYLLVLALQGDRPPVLEARIVEADVRQLEGATYVRMEVSSAGREAAAAVVVETARASGWETAMTTIDFLAGGETRRIYALLPSDGAGPARVRILAYQEP